MVCSGEQASAARDARVVMRGQQWCRADGRFACRRVAAAKWHTAAGKHARLQASAKTVVNSQPTG